MDLINLASGPVNQLIMKANNGVGIDVGELVKDLLIRGYRIQDPERVLPFLKDVQPDVTDPGAGPQGGGLPQDALAALAAGGGGRPSPSPEPSPPTESAIQGDAMRVDRGGAGPNSAIARNTAEGQ